MKVRKGLARSDDKDPSWYKHPAGTVAYEWQGDDAGNTGELLLMTACVAAALPAPLLPIQLLWINLVTDGLPALCLATDPIDSSVMVRPPLPRTARMTDRSFVVMMLMTGLLTAGVALAVYLYMLRISSVEVVNGS